MVVLPTPPFWLAIAMTLVTRASPRIIVAARRPCGATGRDAMLPQPTVYGHRGLSTGSRVVHRFRWITRRPCMMGRLSVAAKTARPARAEDRAMCRRTRSDRRDCDAMRAESRLGGGQERIDQQHERGKLTARERLDLLLDAGLVRRVRRVRHAPRPDFGSTTARSSATASSPATARSTAGSCSSSARTSRSSAARCPRRTPRRSARSWTWR